MPALILHHYDASPFTQMALRMLGLKGLAWQSVETPMIEPKPDLVALTGGYRGTPVLQIGADVYIDSQRIAHELEARFPTPSFYPAGDHGIAEMLVKWAAHFFHSGLYMAINALAADWPPAFRADREALFADIDFASVIQDVSHERGQFLAHAALLDRQLADGRAFLTGDAPGLADIQAFSVPWFARASIPGVNEMLVSLPALAAWEQRVAALGEGQRESLDAATALAVASEATPDQTVSIDAPDRPDLRGGELVEIGPDDSRRGRVTGRLLRLNARGMTVLRDSEQLGQIAVHFPRLGYRLHRL